MRFVSVLEEAFAMWQRLSARLEELQSPPRAVAYSLAIGALALGFFAWLAPDAMPSGDAALYAQQARHLELGERTVHLGYYVLAALFTFFQSAAPDFAFNLFSCLLAASTVSLIAFTTATLSGRVDLGILAGVSLLGSSTFLRQAVWAEVYIGQAFFFLLALWLFARARPAPAGFALAGSLLFSPSTLLAVPGLLATRPRLKAILILGLCGGGVVLAVLAFVWRDYFYGPRGLFGSQATAGGLKAAVVKEGFEVIFGVSALLPFLIIGAWALLSSRGGRGGLGVLALIWAPTFFLAERFPDVPVQLPTWILIAPVLVMGLAWLERRLEVSSHATGLFGLAAMTCLAALPFYAIPVVARRSRSFALLETELVAGLLTLVFVAGGLAWWLARTRPRTALRLFFLLCAGASSVLATRLVMDQNAQFVAFRAQVQALEAEAAVDYVAIGSWEQGILLEHYIYGRPYTGHTINLAELRAEDEAAQLRFDSALRRGFEMWLLSEDEVVEQRLSAAGRELISTVAFRVARERLPKQSLQELGLAVTAAEPRPLDPPVEDHNDDLSEESLATSGDQE